MRVKILSEIQEHQITGKEAGGWQLCYQNVEYVTEDKATPGRRFIWRDPKGHLQPHRGQARIPTTSLTAAFALAALSSGWE